MNKMVIIFVIIIFIIVIFGYIQNERFKKRLQKLNESRPKLTRAEFINLLVEKGFARDHTEVVHDEIERFFQFDNFSIHPQDDINENYRIDDLDAIELIDGICKKLNLRKVEQNDFDELNKNMKLFNAEYILTLTKRLAGE